MAQTMLRDYLQKTEDALSSSRIDEALANCQHILTHFPESLEAQRLLGEVYLKQGHLEEALQTFDWILTSDPENVVVYCDRALISERVSDIDTALDCYQQAYELSRGNSQIRQEFNSLSAKFGQPGFVFSRAGLARLYMRGDLLTQAIQEWESVLVASPDRLDARLGLLEAYWQEGLYDRVEQFARQILDDVPICLKASLLLAYVTYAHHPDQARELIQRVEVLDPELVMAHDLFSDLMARRPDDPFLALLKRGPVTLPESTTGQPAMIMTPEVTPEKISTRANGTPSAPASTDPLFGWSSLNTVTEAQNDYQELPEYTIWSSSDIPDVGSKGAVAKEADLPTPPAWLDMLTQQERPQPSAVPPTPPFAPTVVEPINAHVSQQEILQTTPLTPPAFALDDNDDTRWPEWLKSLGATELESDPSPPIAAQAPAVEPDSQQQPQSRMEQTAEPPAQQSPSIWTEHVAEPEAQQASPEWGSRGTGPLLEGHTVTTLEHLEQSLHSQGFVPLEPGSLSTIASSGQEPTLSSALAQLSNLTDPSQPADSTPPQAALAPTAQPSQPLWPAMPGPASNPSLAANTTISSQPPTIPAYRADSLLESELETTMKRPAVRLQPMQQRPPAQTTQRNSASFIDEGHSGERLPTGGPPASSVSARERLLKGYQYQLAGDYDEAMQEYRTIIRSTSELLSEVISNVRALLKLAPTYAVGYRVLGDAYMRQGEYLQAMEAYNKALTMTKKAKGQGSL